MQKKKINLIEKKNLSENIKKGENELIYKTEIDNKCKCRKRTYGSQTIRKEGRDKLEDWD